MKVNLTKPIRITHEHALLFFFAIREDFIKGAAAEGWLIRHKQRPCASLHHILAEKRDALCVLSASAGISLHAPGF